MTARFRFRPRFRLFAVAVIAVGAFLAASASLTSGDAVNRALAVGSGLVGVALGLLYLLSPAWRVEVLVHDEALEVQSSGDRRFFIPWASVVRVIASPATETCFVDGGDPQRSLKVPGPGAAAPYAIENRRDLYRAILSRVPRERVIETSAIDRYQPEPTQGPPRN